MSAAREGAIFQRMYAYMWCSPSRAALMSGRFPHHVYQEGQGVASPDAGLPLEMTTLAERLRAVGYDAIQAGKWHLGFARRAYLPTARGFDSFFGYALGAQDYYTHDTDEMLVGQRPVTRFAGKSGAGAENAVGHDYWRGDAPLARARVDGQHGSALIAREATSIIAAHAAAARQSVAPRGGGGGGGGGGGDSLFLYIASQALSLIHI